ncbi:MAG TPA: allantoicase [Polyangiaceae bacterium]|nr:allantoicase [Polyangiaceae bacterium]
MNHDSGATFNGLLDLAAASMGGKVLGANDDFFAPCENLIQAGRGEFIPGKFTDRGKWMDGWESRRKRGPGHDWCVLELGVRGKVLGFDVDTNHFLGNHPPFASLDGLLAPKGTPLAELTGASWRELLPQVPLRPGSQNLFVASDTEVVSHLRLNIFPDGGVARLRAYGVAQPEWDERDRDEEADAQIPGDAVDLVAARNGGLALVSSDAFFGPMNNLILPGRAADMGGGWETRRKRLPGHDFILLRLGARGVIGLAEVDTAHFKGNFPDRCSIEVLDAPGARITDLVTSESWVPILPETKLSADKRHFFRDALVAHLPATHVRLRIYPDGGVSRLRLWGVRT